MIKGSIQEDITVVNIYAPRHRNTPIYNRTAIKGEIYSNTIIVGGFIYLFVCLFIFIGVELLYTAVSVSAVQQSESAIRIHISPLFWISFPLRSPQSRIEFTE